MQYNRAFVYKYQQLYFFFPLWRCGPTRAMASSFLRFLDHTQRRSTVGRTPLDAWSARRRDIYVTTHNTHNRQTSMSLVGFEPTISAVHLRLRPRGYWDRHQQLYYAWEILLFFTIPGLMLKFQQVLYCFIISVFRRVCKISKSDY